jgi:hypothetical protein
VSLQNPVQFDLQPFSIFKRKKKKTRKKKKKRDKWPVAAFLETD